MRLLLIGIVFAASGIAANVPALQQRLDQLETEVTRGEDVRAIKKLQRSYGYYVDKCMWDDVANLFAADAVANYPNGVFVGRPSIREHLIKNIGGGKIGLPDGRLYNHMILQPVIHLDAGGKTAKARWRVLAMFGSFGGTATWAEGVYEFTYVKDAGIWKIQTLDYYSGFGAPYATGWVASPGPRAGGARKLAHPPDRPRTADCEGFPAACIAPFHYQSPPGTAWTSGESLKGKGDARERAADLIRRVTLLQDEQEIEDLQRIYGYYVDRGMWDEVADLFASDGTIEMGLRGVYTGKSRIRKFLETAGPQVTEGVLNDHLQLQIIADVAPDGRTAQARSRELAMTGVYQGKGAWSEGVFENNFVKEGGTWKFKSLHFYPTFITDYDQGWAKDAQPAPGPLAQFPPDRPPTQVYEIYPKAYLPPYHYPNPSIANVSGSARAAKFVGDLEPAIRNAELQMERVKDYYDVENLQSAYGYYLDKNLWDDLANLVARDGTMELAQRGVYVGSDRVRGFLLNVFGRGGQQGPVEGRLGNHLQLQPVIHISPDGRTARIRVRLLQQMSSNGRASLGAGIYENEAVKEGGVWKFTTVHTYNTLTAKYMGGWANSPGQTMPGPSKDFPPDRPPTLVFAMFPKVYTVPFHYAHPVTGKQTP